MWLNSEALVANHISEMMFVSGLLDSSLSVTNFSIVLYLQKFSHFCSFAGVLFDGFGYKHGAQVLSFPLICNL